MEPQREAMTITDVPLGKPRRPWAAALLSLLQPGLGQLYNGRPGRALLALGLYTLPIFLLFAGAAVTFLLLVALLVLLLALFAGILLDAVRLAQRSTGFQPRWYNRWYVYLVVVALVGFGVRPLLQAVLRQPNSPARTYSIPSGGMEPTLLRGDYIVAGRAGAPRRGDVVIFESAGNAMVKRIVAVAGDEVEIRAKRISVNGRSAEEPWALYQDPVTYPNSLLPPATALKRDHMPPLRVPAGHVFVLGDNRDHSYDSRFSGPVSVAKLRGRPLYIYWSLDRSRIGRSLVE